MGGTLRREREGEEVGSRLVRDHEVLVCRRKWRWRSLSITGCSRCRSESEVEVEVVGGDSRPRIQDSVGFHIPLRVRRSERTTDPFANEFCNSRRRCQNLGSSSWEVEVVSAVVGGVGVGLQSTLALCPSSTSEKHVIMFVLAQLYVSLRLTSSKSQ